MKRILVGSLALAMMIPSIVMAAMDFTALPPLCKARIEPRSSAEYEAGARQFGDGNWGHMHHYCYALDWMNKYRRARTPQEKQFTLNNVISEYNYVVTHSRPDFSMRPRIYLEMAEAYRLQKNVGGAAQVLEKAVAFQPTLERAHVELMNLMRQAGAREAALDAATRGLRYIPESKRLQQGYLDLGGTRPFPPPIKNEKTVASPDESQALKPEATQAPFVGDDANGASEKKTPAQFDKIETGCRFCPPDEIQERWRDSFDGGK